MHLLSLNPSNIKFSSEKIWERRESNPGWLGGKRKRYRCATPTPVNHLFIFLSQHTVRDLMMESRMRKKEKKEEEKSPVSGRIRTHDFQITRRVLYHCATTAAHNKHGYSIGQKVKLKAWPTHSCPSLFQNLEKDRQIESLKRQLAQAQISGGGGQKSTQNAATVSPRFLPDPEAISGKSCRYSKSLLTQLLYWLIDYYWSPLSTEKFLQITYPSVWLF